MTRYLPLLALVAGLIPAASRAQSPTQAPPPAGPGWEFSVTPYLWAPSIDGKLRYSVPPGSGGASTADVGIDNVNLLEALNAAAMIAAEARYGRYSILTDFIYLDLGNAGSQVRSVGFTGAGGQSVSAGLDRGTESTVRGSLWTLAGGTTLTEGGWGNLDAIGGFRMFSLSASTDVRLAGNVAGPSNGASFARSTHLSRDATLFDGIIGLRGRFELGHGFHLPYAADVGTGASRLTWQATGGLGYQTGWAGVTLGYRHLAYDQSGNKLVQDFSFSGPFLAAKFSF
jgi:hypothetical protein